MHLCVIAFVCSSDKFCCSHTTPLRFLDEISTGLDSAATFDINSTLRSLCHIMQSTLVVSLLQPPPETYDLFDDVIVMGDGAVAYHGPREGAPAYFEQLGYVCPAGMDVADFLQIVTTEAGQAFRRSAGKRTNLPSRRSSLGPYLQHSNS
jgi:ABC-type multidrug transport system ATPase subunit